MTMKLRRTLSKFLDRKKVDSFHCVTEQEKELYAFRKKGQEQLKVLIEGQEKVDWQTVIRVANELQHYELEWTKFQEEKKSKAENEANMKRGRHQDRAGSFSSNLYVRKSLRDLEEAESNKLNKPKRRRQGWGKFSYFAIDHKVQKQPHSTSRAGSFAAATSGNICISNIVDATNKLSFDSSSS